MLDVHILIHPDTSRGWVTQCLDSVYEAMDCAEYPIALHKIDVAGDMLGHIGRGRSAGYALGSHPYVTSVDDDDWLEPDAFAVLRNALTADTPAIYTRAYTWQNGKRCTSNLRQHLRVFHRDVVAGFDWESWPALDSTAIIAHADTFGDAIELPDRTYNYRLRLDGVARAVLAKRPDVLAAGKALSDGHKPRAVV